MSRPRVSTSSLSNWLIGNPSQLASTGVRSSSAVVGQHHAAGVQRDVPGQAVEALDEVEEGRAGEGRRDRGAQLGQLGEGVPGVAGADVRERLGDRVDLDRRQPERGADVADGVAHPVGVHHRHARDPVAAEAVEDALVDLGAAGRLDVDVDVGQLGAQRGAEPLHEQAVAHRVDPADAEQVVDQAAGARAAGRDPHPAIRGSGRTTSATVRK